MQKDTLNQPQDDNTSFLGATNVWPTLGGQDNAGSNVVVGVIDTGVWPESPYFVNRGLPAPPHPLSFYHCDFGNGSDVGASRPDVRLQQQADRRVQLHADVHGDPGSDGQEFCNNTTDVCSAARLRGPRHAHDDDRRR